MNWSKNIKKLTTKLFITCGVLTTLTACDNSFIYDDEGDCTPHYRMIFDYSMNLKWTNAFHNGEAKSVRVYAFDKKTNKLVKTYTVSDAEALQKENFYIDLDLEPGDYHFVGWCGIDNTNVSEQSFEAPETPGMTLEDLYCKLNWKSNSEYEAYSDTMLQWMFWGEVDGVIESENETGGYIYYTMPLIKDVNHISITLMQQNNEPISEDDFEFKIVTENGLMSYDNSLLSSPVINYLPWDIKPVIWTTSDDVDSETDPETKSGETVDDNNFSYHGLKVDITMGRIVASQRDNLYLIVTKKADNKVSFKIPFVQYALNNLSYYEIAYEHRMSSQEFLDRKDEYELTLVLGEDLKYLNLKLDILSWRIVEHYYELTS